MPDSLSLPGLRNRQPPQAHGGNLLWKFFGQCRRQYSPVNLAVSQGEITCDGFLRAFLHQHVSLCDPLCFVLPGNLPQIAIQRLDSAIESSPIMVIRKRFEFKHERWL